MTSKIKIWGPKFVHFGRFEGSFLTVLRVKKVVCRLFKFVLVSFRKCLGFVFRIKMAPFVLFATYN